MNFTGLPDGEYAEIYRSEWERFAAYNEARRRAPSHPSFPVRRAA